MSCFIPQERIVRMNSILEHELERLGEYNSVSPKKETSEKILSPADINRSSFPRSVQKSNIKRPSSTSKLQDTESVDIEEAALKGIRVQKELINLHYKVLDLEKRITSVDGLVSQENVKTSMHSSNNISLHNSLETHKANFTQENNQLTKKLSPLKSSLKLSSSQWARTTGGLGTSSLIDQDHLGLSGSSPLQLNDKDRKLPLSLPKQEKSSRQRSLKRQPSESSMFRTDSPSSFTSGRSGRFTESWLGSKEPRRYDQEIIILNKQLMNVRREYEQEREAVANEKLKGQELAEEIKGLTKKMKEMIVHLEHIDKVKTHYDKLAKSYGKSEQIREQQRQLIDNMSCKRTLLRAEKYRLLEAERCQGSRKNKENKKRARSKSKNAKGI